MEEKPPPLYNKAKKVEVLFMQFDLNKPYCRYFNEMLQIPHGSTNEKAISDWVVSFAKEHQLRYIQDEMGNVVVYKEASLNYQDHEPVILQAHLDMVCEKLEEVDHDFLKDPIQTEVKDGWLISKGTTLGADDGSGVSCILAVLADQKLEHPALECAFTVQEEIGLLGAMNLKKEYFQAKRMINMDCGAEGTTVTSTAGGIMVDLKENYLIVEKSKPSYRLHVSGLLGGHSGSNINKERANAIKLTFRVLKEWTKNGLDIQLVSVEGGNKVNAIPRECQVVFASIASYDELNHLKKLVLAKVKKEYEASDANIEIDLFENKEAKRMMGEKESLSLINMMSILPTGLRSSSRVIQDLPMASLNLASIYLMGGECIIRYSLRSALESWLELLEDELHCISEQFGFSFEASNHYPAWAYSANSKMREILAEVYAKKTQKELQYGAGHGGTECGVFCELIEGIDIVTMVPQAEGAHTPQERLNLASLDRTYELLCEFLKAL